VFGCNGDVYFVVLQEKAARLPPVEEIRTVLANGVRGMLSTFSQVLHPVHCISYSVYIGLLCITLENQSLVRV